MNYSLIAFDERVTFWLQRVRSLPCACAYVTFQRFSRAGPRGRGREWATLGVHPLSWLLSNSRLEEVCSTLTKGTFSSRLLLSNQVKGCSPSVAHSLPLPLGPALLNLSIICAYRLAYNHYAITQAYNTASTHAQGSDPARWSPKITLSSKAIGV